MGLKKYQQKRKFTKTPEPRGNEKQKTPSSLLRAGKNEKLIFVIHDHYARQHHHDLRLEMDVPTLRHCVEGTGSRPECVGRVLRSWAVPKLTPLKVGEKHLAIQVEDHPLEYAKFTGKIPEGEYGAGEVKIFDKGTFTIIHRSKKSIEIYFNGKIIKGIYALIQFKDEPKNWLFFKTNKKFGGENAGTS